MPTASRFSMLCCISDGRAAMAAAVRARTRALGAELALAACPGASGAQPRAGPGTRTRAPGRRRRGGAGAGTAAAGPGAPRSIPPTGRCCARAALQLHAHAHRIPCCTLAKTQFVFEIRRLGNR